jgi:hypothetical protein
MSILYWWTRTNKNVVSKLVINPLMKPQPNTTTTGGFKTLSSHTIKRNSIFTLGRKIVPRRQVRQERAAPTETPNEVQELPPDVSRRTSVWAPVVHARVKPPGTA